jgi:drug/metabolite transporter (DMT)-like permease
VLLAACLNAAWNMVVKSGTDKALDVALVSGIAGTAGAIALLFLPQPARASWPFILASVPIQLLYYSLLALVYRRGDMTEAYPLMRGSAPLLVALASVPLVGEVLKLHQLGGVTLICTGAFIMAMNSHVRGNAGRGVIPVAIATGAVIALYTIVDGLGVRRSGSPFAYALWVFVLTALPLVLWTMIRRRAALIAYGRARLPVSLLGGASTIGSYGITLSAMSAAPVALVAALRETSILFATVMAVLILKEQVRWPRYLAIALIAIGAIALRLS